MNKKNIGIAALVLIMLYGGCGLRARIPEDYNTNKYVFETNDASEKMTEGSDDPSVQHINDQEADNKEYADGKDAEISEDTSDIITDLTVNPEKNDEEKPQENADAIITDNSEQKHTITIENSSDTAEEFGIDKNGEVADSAVVYYQTLLKKLDGDLFECEKYYVYMEMTEDYQTVHKSSEEHKIILQAASYDVASKLQEGALKVNEGWVLRKNPGAIVKFVSSKVLGEGINDTSAAEEVIKSICSRENWKEIDAVKHNNIIILSEKLLESEQGRFAASLYIAKMLYPDELQEVQPEEAQKNITEELGAHYTVGVYAYKR